MIYVSTPGQYTEIDGYASCIAYAELLKRKGKAAEAFFATQPNYSVPSELRIEQYENILPSFSATDKFIILDLSIPEVIKKFIPENQIIELIDHHHGFESYWQERLAEKAYIDKIGAVATVIFERWAEELDYTKMPQNIAKLLLAAILDNTLNFNAIITTDRDRVAANQLAEIINTTVPDFAGWYFSKVSETITANLPESIRSDHKPFHIPKLAVNIECAQLTLWDANILTSRTEEICNTMNEIGQTWLCSILSIKDRRNFILTNNSSITEYLHSILGLTQNGTWLVSDRLWLRKEIFAKILEDK